MKKSKKEESYLETMIDYQDKMNLPGYYLGGNINPALKAKTKFGGYAMIIGGTVLLPTYLTLMLVDFKIENIGFIIGVLFSVLLIIVGIRFLKENKQTKVK